MPVPSPLDNDRLEALLGGDPGETDRERELQAVLRELREAPAPAPDDLRAKVAALAPAARAPRWAFARVRPPRRAALALASLCLLGIVAAVALTRPASDQTAADEGAAPTAAAVMPERARTVVAAPATGGSGAAEGSTGASSPAPAADSNLRASGPVHQQAPAPAPARAQDYRADLTVLVDDVDELSRATQQAMRITRSLGGFVVSANYGKPVGEDGDSSLTVRVPVTRVQEAIGRFGDLGTIIAQNISIRDLQGQLNRQTESIASLRKTIARIERLLQDRTLSAETRARLEFQLDDARRQLAQQRAGREQTLRTARLSHVSLTLTTRDEGVVVPAPPGEFEETLRAAFAVLATVLAWLLAALIVMSPFIAVVAAAWLLSRHGRRRANEALLERS